MSAKLKVVRVVTASYVVPWHLHNMLMRMPLDFDVAVVGQAVSTHAASYPLVSFIDIDIHRKQSVVADMKAILQLFLFLRSYRPDIVHSIMPKAGLLAAIAGFLCRVPLRMHTFTGQIWTGRTGVARRFLWAVDRLINQLNHVCLTDSPSQSAYLYRHNIWYCNKPLPVIASGSLSGVDTVKFDAQRLKNEAIQFRKKLNITSTDFVFVFLARKTVEKGAVDMLRAFAAISKIELNTRLLFVGPDEDGEIERLKKSEPDLFQNVLEFGEVQNYELYLAAADVLCAPSYREGFGTVVIEAAALGVPSIGSRIPGLVDSISEDYSGLLFEPGNIEELSALMVKLTRDTGTRKSLGLQGQSRSTQYFSVDILYSELKKFYLDNYPSDRRN